MHYIVALFGWLVLSVYWDATKYKIGQVAGEALPNNLSAMQWALRALLIVPAVRYFRNRKELLARAAEHPVETPHALRNRMLIACTMGFFVFLVSLGGEGGNIALVKGGVLDADKRTTVGEALDNYKYFRSCRWESGRSDNGIDFVNAIGELDLDSFPNKEGLAKQGITKVEALFQFAINKDCETCEYSYFTQVQTLKDGTTHDVTESLANYPNLQEAFRALGMPDKQDAIERVYANAPLVGPSLIR